MIWPLTWVVICGTLPGVFLGAFIRVNYLPDPLNFKLFAAAVLLGIGMKMLADLRKKKNGRTDKAADSEKRFRETLRQQRPESRGPHPPVVDLTAATISHCNLKTLSYTFYDEKFEVSFWGIFSLSAVVGIIGGIYGIGGGSIIAPLFVTLFGLPVHTVAGAALMGTFVTSIAGVAFYQAIAPFYPHLSVTPDWLLGILFGIGGMAGMYLGARCQKYVPARAIKWMLATIIIAMAMKYLAEFLFTGPYR
jgi:hypothetical protein